MARAFMDQWVRRLALATLLVSAVPAVASAQTRGGRAQVFAREHGVPVRVVETGPAERRVRREFVPIVSAEAYASFQRTFGAQAGGVTVSYDGNTHLVMSLEAGESFLWARNRRNAYGGFKPNGGRTFAIRLEGGLDHLRGWLAQRAAPTDALYCWGRGNCMEWLPNAEVGPGVTLFQRLGLRRSRDGRNMRAKLVYAANELLDVIGVHVANVEQFNAMSEADLLGRPPAGGVDDATR